MTYPPQDPGQPQYQPYTQQPPATWPPQPSYAPPGPPQRRRRKPWSRGRKAIAWTVGGIVALIVIASAVGGGKHPAPAAAPAAATTAATAQAAAPAARKTSTVPAVPVITYIVTGSPADVTYGPEGSNSQGTVPMHVKARLGNAGYYAIQAQLQGDGSVTVKIEINGKVISSGRAEGGYNIAQAEISQDPITGQWEDTQSQ